MKFIPSSAISGIVCIAILIFIGCGQSVPKDEELAAVSKHVADEFKSELMGELRAALEDTTISTAGAIYVCAERAPAISARYSGLPGLTIKRTSKRLRNPDNAPDEFESRILDTLLSRPAYASQDHYEWEESANGNRFRYVSAIKANSLCLKCHGNPDKMDDDVKNALAERYENDQATGFGLDELRGIMSVTMEWPEAKAVFDSIKASM